MLSLLNSERFQKEYAVYRSRINNITNQDVRIHAEMLLRNLVNEIKKFDTQHQEMLTANKISLELNDVRNGMLSIRKKINTLLKDWESKNSKV